MRTAVWFAAMALIWSSVTSASPIGRVFFVQGGAYVERAGQKLPATRDMVLESGDLLVTESDGRLQWRLSDDSYYAIRPSSQFRLSEFSFAEGAGSGQSRSALDLVRGGFRTLTGLIGKNNTANYSVRTPVATMGVRGTDLTLLFCSSDCNWNGSVAENGLYIRVDNGVIEMVNDGGRIEVQGGQYAFVGGRNIAPRVLPAMPAIFASWREDFEFRFPGLDPSLSRVPRIEPPCSPVPSPNQPCF